MPIIHDDGSSEDVYVEYDAVKAETPKAKLISVDGEEIWVPLSQIKEDDGSVVIIPRWLAKAKGLL
jgi:hypothetical protein